MDQESTTDSKKQITLLPSVFARWQEKGKKGQNSKEKRSAGAKTKTAKMFERWISLKINIHAENSRFDINRA